MKRLLFFIMALFIMAPSYSEQSYALPFISSKNGVTKIPFIENEWTLASEREDWSLYIEKEMTKQYSQTYDFHAATLYKVPYYSDGLRTKISKIYTYGTLNCKDGMLHIFAEWFVDADETLVFRSTHEYGAYIIEMLTPDTARNEVYNQLCKEMI